MDMSFAEHVHTSSLARSSNPPAWSGRHLLLRSTVILAFLVASAPLFGGRRPGQIDIYDGFEQDTLSSLWSQDRFENGAVVMESSVVRSGHKALAITVRSHDKFEAGSGGSKNSERDELLEANPFNSKEGVPYEFSFSMFFPKDFPIVPTRLVIAQWKQQCPTGDGPCSDTSPVLALRYMGGALLVTQDLQGQRIVLYRQVGEFRNRWLDFRVQARFTPQSNGFARVWLNGQQIVRFTGITANPENHTTGFDSPSTYYFKMGLYRDVMSQPMTVYIDEYRKRTLEQSLR